MATQLGQFLNNLPDLSYERIAKNSATVNSTVAGIEGVTFTLTRNHEVSLSSSITDYPVEDGNYTENVVSVFPEQVKITGMVAEIAYTQDPVKQMLDTLSSALVPVGAFFPSVGNLTQRVIDQVESLYGEATQLWQNIQTAASLAAYGMSLLGLNEAATGLLGLAANEVNSYTQQEKVYLYLELCWKSRRLMTIETPWRYFDNMVIESLKVVQDGDSKYNSEFEVSFKRIVPPNTRQSEQTQLKAGRAAAGSVSSNDPGNGAVMQTNGKGDSMALNTNITTVEPPKNQIQQQPTNVILIRRDLD